MGVLKNDVGRPSKKTIMIRTILKGLLLIIVAVGIFVLGYYYNDKNNIEKKDKNTTTKVKKEEKDLSLSDAEKIMYGFFDEENIFDYFDVKTFNSNTFKTAYAIIKTKPNKASYTCEELFGNDIESHGQTSTKYWGVKVSDDFSLLCEDNEEKDYYSYEDVSKTFNNLFSNGKVVKDFVAIGLAENYAYSKNKNLYTWLSCECGEGGFTKVYKVTGAKKDNDKVYIYFKIATLEPSDDEDTYVGLDDNGKEVSMNIEDVNNNDFSKLQGDYKTYTFTFEKIDNNYKFVEVK